MGVRQKVYISRARRPLKLPYKPYKPYKDAVKSTVIAYERVFETVQKLVKTVQME